MSEYDLRGGAQGGELPTAGLGARLAAWLIDVVACLVPAVIVYLALIYATFKSTWYMVNPSFSELLGRGAELVAQYPSEYVHVWLIPAAVWFFLAFSLCILGGARGQTLGRKATGVRLVSAATGQALGGIPALGRAAVFNFVPFIAPVSLIMILADGSRRRGLHDRLVNAVVSPAHFDQHGYAQFDPAQARLAQATAPAPPQPHDTQIMRSPLARSLDAPPQTGTTPPAPLPAWLERPGAPSAPTAASSAPSAPPAAPAPAAPSPVPHSPVPPRPTSPPAPGPVTPSQINEPVSRPPTPTVSDASLAPEVEMTRLVPPGQTRREYRPSAPTPEARIRVSDGQVVDIRGTTLVGRNPAPRPGERAVTLLSVQDPGRSVSKTHIVFGIDGRGLWVADRTSTNGSVVTLADGQQIVCMPEQQVRVTPGAKIQIGNIVITVLPV